MAASGLTGAVNDNAHVVAVAKFAIELLVMIEHINEHSFNNFNLRIGIHKNLIIFEKYNLKIFKQIIETEKNVIVISKIKTK